MGENGALAAGARPRVAAVAGEVVPPILTWSGYLAALREMIGLTANSRRERQVWSEARNLIVDRKRLQHRYETGLREHQARSCLGPSH